MSLAKVQMGCSLVLEEGLPVCDGVFVMDPGMLVAR